MKILVTGCKGQVGQSLFRLLEARDDVELLALERNKLDITNQQEVDSVVVDFAPDLIINAAAYTAVDKAESDTQVAAAINRDGPLFLAEAAQKVGAALLHISTDYVFDGKGVKPYSEQDVTAPLNVYGKTKLEGELAVASACERHIILRTAWVFSEYGNNFVKTMLRLVETHDNLNIVGDQLGGPTYALDIARALVLISEQIMAGKDVQYGIYHFSGLPHVSWYEFARAIFSAAESQTLIAKKPSLKPIMTAEYPTVAKRPINSKLSVEKIFNHFEIEASDWQRALNNLSAYKHNGDS